jgi:hypothetical protein
MVKLKYPWIPHVGQLAVLLASNTYRFITLVCGRRWGKTELACNKLIRSGWDDPREYRYIAPTYKLAKKIAWRKLKKLLPPEMRRLGSHWKNEVELWVENSRGARIQLLGADDPDSLVGEGWKGVVIDETDDTSFSLWQIIRPALADFKGWCWRIGTPEGYYILFEAFIKDKDFQDSTYRDINNEEIKPDNDYKSFKFKSMDNPYLDPNEIESMRKDMTDEMFRQECEASFENYTGLIYKEFMLLQKELILPAVIKDGRVVGFIKDEKEHKLESWWNYYDGIDTGRKTGWLLIAVDDQENEYVCDEIFDVDGIVLDIASKIKEKRNHINMHGSVIDSASQVKREYETQKLYFEDSMKDVQESIQMTRNKFRIKKKFVLDCCPAFLRELRSRKWNERRVQGKAEPVKENDHLCNADDYIENTLLRYGARTKNPKEKAYKNTLEYHVTKKDNRDWRKLG